MSEHKNFVRMSVSGTPGTGTITLGSAVSGYQSLAAAYGANATVDVSITDGTAWEVARQCSYTNSGTTLTRGTLEASSTGSAISLTSAAIVTVTATADFGRRMESAALNHVAGTDANTTMAVGNLYVVDMSAWATADRTYTLPAVAAVGDRVGVMVSAGDASHGLLITAASGDTLNAVAGGTEWSRVFITGEVVIMRCITANSTWIIEHDGRIACNGAVTRTTAQTLSNGSFIKINVATNEFSVGDIVNTTNNRIDVRRNGKYLVGGFVRLELNDGQSLVVGLALNGTVVARGQGMSAMASGTVGMAALTPISATVGQYFELYAYHERSPSTDTSTISDSVPRLFAMEVL